MFYITIGFYIVLLCMFFYISVLSVFAATAYQ